MEAIVGLNKCSGLELVQAMSVFAHAGAEASDYGLIVAVALNKLPLPFEPPYSTCKDNR